MKTQMVGPHPRISGSIGLGGLGVGIGICISIKLPRDAQLRATIDGFTKCPTFATGENHLGNFEQTNIWGLPQTT